MTESFYDDLRALFKARLADLEAERVRLNVLMRGLAADPPTAVVPESVLEESAPKRRYKKRRKRRNHIV